MTKTSNTHKKAEVRWISPFHARGLQSANLAHAHVRGPLTDKKIAKYAERGWYSNQVREMRRERNAKRMEKLAIREGNFTKLDGRLIYSPK